MMNDPDNKYDPAGGHTEQEAEAEYARLFKELHGEELESDMSDITSTSIPPVDVGDDIMIVSDSDGDPRVLVARVTGAADISGAERCPAFIRDRSGASPGALVWHYLNERSVMIDDELAREILVGIIKVTNNFKSPETTPLDREAAVALATGADIDIAALTLTLFD